MHLFKLEGGKLINIKDKFDFLSKSYNNFFSKTLAKVWELISDGSTCWTKPVTERGEWVRE